MAALDYIPYGEEWGDYDETDGYPEGGGGPRYKSCKRCGTGYLHWRQDPAGWRLYNTQGARHSCFEPSNVFRTFNEQNARSPKKRPTVTQPTRTKETTMQYNIAAILRKDAFTVQARFPGSDNLYTYVTNDKTIKVDDFAVVFVPSGAMKIVQIKVVDNGCVFPKELNTDYKWIVSRIDMTRYEENERINNELVQAVEDARREHFRKQVVDNLFSELTPEAAKLVQYKLDQIPQ